MAPRLVEVCVILVQEKFGRLAADVFETLARHGRLTVPEILQQVYIIAPRLRSIILILITHNVLLWHQSDTDQCPYFEVDWHAAYVMVREHKLIRLVEERHGKVARRLLQDILHRGKVEVGSFEDEQHFDLGSPRDSGIGMMDEQVSEEGAVKTVEDEHITTVACFYNTLRLLLEDGFLVKITDRDHLPVAELEAQLRAEVIASDPKTFKDGKTTGPKTATAFVKAANTLKRKWQSEAEYSSQHDVASQGTIKRSKRSSGGNKRRKVDEDLTDGYHDFHNNGDEDEDVEVEVGVDPSVRKLPHDMWLRVNLHKCMIALRTEHLEKLAEEHLGPMSSAVYSGAMRAAERKIHSARSQLRVRTEFDVDEEGESSPVNQQVEVTIADGEILDRLPKDLELSSTIKEASDTTDDAQTDGLSKKGRKRQRDEDDDGEGQAADDASPDGTSRQGKKPRLNADDQEAEEGADAVKKEGISEEEDEEPIVNGVESATHRQKRLRDIGMHLELLSESSRSFLKRDARTRTSSVIFDGLSKTLVDAELDRMILARVGKVGLRVVRVLRTKGKLSDTQIAGMCLKRLKDLRGILTNLQALGFIDVQEVPKDNYRQPSKTIYLWQFNEHEVRQMFLQETYRSMARTLQRRAFERYRNRDIIEKWESLGEDTSRLNKAERDLLARWHATEERLDVTIMRLDDVVLVLRDFDEGDTSLLS